MTWLRVPVSRPCDLCGTAIAQGDVAHRGDYTPIVRCAACAKRGLGLDVPAEIREPAGRLKAPSSWGRFAAPAVKTWGERDE